MNKKQKKKISRIYGIIAACVIVGFTVYVLLDTFVIVRSYRPVEQNPVVQTTTEETPTAASEQPTKDTLATTEEVTTEEATTEEPTEPPVLTVTRIEDYAYGSHIHIIDLQLTDITELKCAFAYDTYGKNVKQIVRDMSMEHNAWAAINGDFYGARDTGYVLRNGVLYRGDKTSNEQEDAVIYRDGTMDIICEGDITAQELLDNGAWQILTFGPGLVKDGQIIAKEGASAEQELSSNPRSSIGMIEPNHYIFFVSDGRTDTDAGLSVYQVAEYMQGLGCVTAYNLDGGGSSTMWFENDIINFPTSWGTWLERYVSDIVYVEYPEE